MLYIIMHLQQFKIVKGITVYAQDHRDENLNISLIVVGYSYDIDGIILTGTTVLDLLRPIVDVDQLSQTDFDWLTRDESSVDTYK